MEQGSTAARCAECGAVLAPDAPWCSLCFTPVPLAAPVIAPPPPEPAVAVEHPALVPEVHVAPGHPLYPHITPETLGRTPGTGTGRHARPAQPVADDAFRLRPVAVGVPQPRLVDAPVSAATRESVQAAGGQPAAAAKPAPVWPCTRCGAAVPMALDACPECGNGFMEGMAGATPSLVLPVIGDLGRKSQAQRYAIAAGVGLAGALLLVAVVALLGAVF